MKKVVLSLIAILMGVMLANCGGEKNSEGSGNDAKDAKESKDVREAKDIKDVKDKLKSIEEEASKNGNSWSLEEWERVLNDYYIAIEEFIGYDITEEEFNELEELDRRIFQSLDDDAKALERKALDNICKDVTFTKRQQKLIERLDELEKKWAQEKEAKEAEE